MTEMAENSAQTSQGKLGQKHLGCGKKGKETLSRKKKTQSKTLATTGTLLTLPQQTESRSLILRHYQDVLSRFPQHAINIEWGRGEAIFVPVSAFIKTQPGGKKSGRITERRATNRLELSESSQSRGADLRRPSPNMPNWQRRVSDGHQRSSLVQEEDAVLLLKDLQMGTSIAFSIGDIMQKHTSCASKSEGDKSAFRGLMSEMCRWHKFSGFICFINKSCTYFAKGWLSNHLCLTSLLLHWRTEEQALKVGIEGWVRFLLLFT